MASLKALRNRIASVKATRKITKAQQMVAASKFRRALDAAVAAGVRMAEQGAHWIGGQNAVGAEAEAQPGAEAAAEEAPARMTCIS